MIDFQSVNHDWTEGRIPTTQYLTAEQIICSAIEDVSRNEAGLSLSQYRVLLRACQFGENRKAQREYARVLHLRENVVSHAVAVLEKRGLIVRTPDPLDKRVKLLGVTNSGNEIALSVSKIVNEKFNYIYIDADSWITDSIEEVAVFAGRLYEGTHESLVKPEVSSERISAHIILFQHLAEGVHNKFGITLTEARIMKCLGEMGEPMRLVAMAHDLVLSQATVHVMVNDAESRNWVKRIGAQNNKRAVFAELTDQGRAIQDEISLEIDRLFRLDAFDKLDANQKKAVIAIGPHVLTRIYSDFEQTIKILPLR